MVLLEEDGTRIGGQQVFNSHVPMKSENEGSRFVFL